MAGFPPFWWLNNIPLYIIIPSLYPFIWKQTGYFQVIAMNHTYGNDHEGADNSSRFCLISFGYIPRSKISESYGSAIFNILRHAHTISIVAVPIYIPPVVHKGSLFSKFLATFVFFFLMVDIQMGMKWWLIIILVCISLMISDVKHDFTYVLTICVSLGKCPHRSSAHLLIRLSDFAFELYKFFFVFGHTHGMWKFLGQQSNPYQWPKPQQWQHHTLNLMNHQGTSKVLYIFWILALYQLHGLRVFSPIL